MFFVQIISAQTKLVNENIEKNKYSLKFKSIINYSIQKNNNRRVFTVKDFYDESKSGEARLPSHDVFISLPEVSSPKLKYKITKQKVINAIPEFNPSVTLSKEDEVIYKKPKYFKNSKTDFIIEKGYLWIGDEYCLHLEVHPAIFNSSKNVIEQTQEFEIELLFSNDLQKNISKQVESNEPYSPIINTKFNLSNLELDNKYNIQNDDSWIDYSKTYLKLGVARDGIYRFHSSDLESQGINVQSINPKTFKLLLRGKEIPIWVEGEDDLSFDQNDYIEFAGTRNMGGHHREISNFNEPYNEYLGRYTDTTVYWLTWDGIDGKRVQLSDGNLAASTDTLEYYSQIEHYEKNNWFDFSCASLVRREMPYWIENKTWIEGGLNVGIRNKTFSVSDIYPNTSFYAFVKLQDWVSNITKNAHHLALSLNSYPEIYDSTYVDKYAKAILSFDVSSDLVNNGNNTLKIHSFQTEATINSCFFDWYEIEYPRYLKPFSDSLNFSFPFIINGVEKWIKLQGVSSDSYSIWKYGDSYKKYNVSKINSEVIFADTIKSNNKFTFIDESKIQTPRIYYAKQFVNLRSSQNKADYIAITHNKFKSKSDEYAQFIAQNYNLETKVILINDIYDEFSYGFFNPESIQDFLKATHTYWQDPKPQDIFIIGGATYDYYGNKHKNFGIDRVLNYVPSFGASVSDNWFVTWDTTGAYIPQMNIGRIPVTTNEEFEWYFEKHRNYLTQEYDDWNKHYLFFSGGDGDNQSEQDLLRETNQFVIDNYTSSAPIGGKTDHFYKTIDPKTNFGPYLPEYIQNSIENGGVFISYLGHSGTQTWDNSITHPSQLKNNRDRYPIVSDFGCSTARFAEPDIVSFSQLFTLDDVGQCLGYIGNSSLGFISTSISMPKFFYKKILAENIHNVSEAHKLAKLEMLQTYGSTGVYALFALTNTLIGDPLITLPIPQKPNFVTLSEDIDINTDLITDLQDSVEVGFMIFNYGTVLQDSLEILVLHSYQTQVDSIPLRIKIPNFKDSLSVKLAVKDMSGNHQMIINLDPQNNFEELSKEDNISSVSFYVASSSIRPIIQYQVENGFNAIIALLNPTSDPNSESIAVEYSLNKDFYGAKNFEVQLDTLFTQVNFSDFQKNVRYWFRTKIIGPNNFSSIYSLFSNSLGKFYLGDSLSLKSGQMNNLVYTENSTKLSPNNENLFLYSSGWMDGNTASILKNGIQMIPASTLRGHHICLFDRKSVKFVEYKLFDIKAIPEDVDKYITFLDTLSERYFVAISIASDGDVTNSELRSKLHSIGSKFIDSLKLASSWAIIGYKGAQIGSVPEAYSLATNGPVSIDTTISFLSDRGTMVTTEIGPTSKWDKLVVSQETPSNSSITYTPIGIRDEGVLDTLQSLVLQDSVADLSFINSDLYPKIKLLAEFQVSDEQQSPVLNSLGVDYTDVAELGLNYQVVSVEHDSVTQGEKNKLSFYIYNVGESLADSFNVKVELLKPDNSTQLIDKFTTSVDSMSRKYFEYNYTLLKEYGWGNMYFAITADEENQITEFFEDNNYYQIPFYVKKDTLTDIVTAEATITIDGYDIIDGDFVSSQPEIIFQIDYNGPFPVYDTTAVNYYMDNERIAYVDMQVDIDTVNQTIKSTYLPSLKDGDHFLKISGDLFSLEKYFAVSNELKIVDLYNYPNPFSDKTSFTFKLTKVPEEVVIKIYTVAGRLIKNISLTSGELKTDFNKIEWDGRDEDGDQIANGVYIYKVILKDADESESYIQKLVVMR